MIFLIKKGDCFGEISFFSGKKRTASARAVDFSTLYTLSREDFLRIIKFNDDDLVRF